MTNNTTTQLAAFTCPDCGDPAELDGYCSAHMSPRVAARSMPRPRREAPPLAAGTRVAYRGVAGTVLGSDMMVELMYRVSRDDGRIATLKRSELVVAAVHDRATMYTTCPCVGCVEMRRSAGRHWAVAS